MVIAVELLKLVIIVLLLPKINPAITTLLYNRLLYSRFVIAELIIVVVL